MFNFKQRDLMKIASRSDFDIVIHLSTINKDNLSKNNPFIQKLQTMKSIKEEDEGEPSKESS